MALLTPEEVKEVLAELREESSRMCDNIHRKDVAQIALLALTQQDIENLKTLAEADGRVKNYAVLIRRVIAAAAKVAKATQVAQKENRTA